MIGAPGSRLQSVLMLAALAVVLVAVLFFRPGGEDESAAPPPAPTSSSAPPVPTPSEEEFCAEFRRLAAAQGEYAAAPDQTATELLRDAADRLVAVGVPESMNLPARGGYYTVVEGIYASLGLTLDRSSVGALEEPVAGEDEAFSSYLVQYCPA